MIDQKTLSSIFGIVNSFVIFNCGDKEAERMAGIVRASISTIMDRSDYNAYLRLGTSSSMMRTFPPLQDSFVPEPIKTDKEKIYNFLSDDWIHF